MLHLLFLRVAFFRVIIMVENIIDVFKDMVFDNLIIFSQIDVHISVTAIFFVVAAVVQEVFRHTLGKERSNNLIILLLRLC